MNAICVDDEELILTRTVSLVNKTKLFDNVRAFMEPEEAISYLDKDHAELALLDIDMPQMGGLELAEKLKEKNPGIKVIFLTGYSEYAIDAYAMHATGYLLKPVGYDKLLSELQYALGSAAGTAQAPENSEKANRVKIETFGYYNILVEARGL